METLLLINKEELSEMFREQITQVVKTLTGNTQKPVESNTSDLSTRKQAATYLHISLPTLNAWTKEGIIKSRRIQSRVYYSKLELQRFSK